MADGSIVELPISPDRQLPHLLVMNDEQMLLDLFRDLLEEEGYRVTTATYPMDLAKVRELDPDVMILDIMFAGDSMGWPFITMARLDRQLCRIPIVLCTAAVTTVEPMAERLADQRVRLVYKPFNLDELLAALVEVRRGSFQVVAYRSE